MEYTPQSPKQSEPPKPTYELKTDVTGKLPPVRGAVVIEAMKYNNKGEKQIIKLRVPKPPTENCKRCHGRGYVGFDTKTQTPIFCNKCFPPR
jgi:hypothetical protein